MRFSLIFLGALVGGAVANPCKPEWQKKRSSSLLAASGTSGVSETDGTGTAEAKASTSTSTARRNISIPPIAVGATSVTDDPSTVISTTTSTAIPTTTDPAVVTSVATSATTSTTTAISTTTEGPANRRLLRNRAPVGSSDRRDRLFELFQGKWREVFRWPETPSEGHGSPKTIPLTQEKKKHHGQAKVADLVKPVNKSGNQKGIKVVHSAESKGKGHEGPKSHGKGHVSVPVHYKKKDKNHQKSEKQTEEVDEEVATEGNTHGNKHGKKHGNKHGKENEELESEGDESKFEENQEPQAINSEAEYEARAEAKAEEAERKQWEEINKKLSETLSGSGKMEHSWSVVKEGSDKGNKGAQPDAYIVINENAKIPLSELTGKSSHKHQSSKRSKTKAEELVGDYETQRKELYKLFQEYESMLVPELSGRIEEALGEPKKNDSKSN
ncbi:hypothetical protein FZEAL_6847 [Fusarium zealandicum]|uniref:Uncharacterized protein n=1 Tax=Fusarium zealandicum TaxID=1053134 RepID=A0A8H4XJ25_9HYPO|nr:hypothetical protein FZEAL_6847 [Fusarium zealandicum]